MQRRIITLIDCDATSVCVTLVSCLTNSRVFVEVGKDNRDPVTPSAVYLKNYNLSDISVHIVFSYVCSSE